jgi:peptidyl serine alpha-galactosyltransferase
MFRPLKASGLAVVRTSCRYSKELLELMPTHVAASYTHNTRTGDVYAAYNKPGAVVDYLANNNPPEHWLLIVDSGKT